MNQNKFYVYTLLGSLFFGTSLYAANLQNSSSFSWTTSSNVSSGMSSTSINSGQVQLQIHSQNEGTPTIVLTLTEKASVQIRQGKKLVSTQEFPAGKHVIDTNKLAPGAYQLEVKAHGSNSAFDMQQTFEVYK